MTLATEMMSAWAVVPLTAVVMVLVAGHTLALRRVEMPPARRRLRTASGALILVVAPILAYALCWVSPEDQRGFVLTWMVITALVSMLIVLSAVDIISSARAARQEAARLARELRSGVGAAGGVGGVGGAGEDQRGRSA